MQQGTHVITEVIVTLDIIYVGSKAFKMTREVRAALTDRTADADAGNPTTSAGSQTGAALAPLPYRWHCGDPRSEA